MKSRIRLIYGLLLLVLWARVFAGESSIAQLQAQQASGQLTAEQLTSAYLTRIAELDKAGPKLNAVIELNPDALAIARQLDEERRAGHVRGPLHGIPILLKDNIATADRMETTAGSLALVGERPPADAPVVQQLRAAGAVILGKTNLSEWANFRGDKSVSGWSGRGGQTHHPYALDRNPSGSSAGSAVAVAADLCAVAVGTETNGSIISPSSICGVVGFKPTVGLVSRTGIIPISITQDTAGPIARTVADAAALLEGMAAVDARDTATRLRPAGLRTDFTHQLTPGALQGARLGVLHGPFGFDERLDPLLGQAVAALQAAGAVIVDLGEHPELRKASASESDVLLYEFKDGLNAYLATLGPAAPVKTLTDLIAFNQAHAPDELRIFGQELLIAAEAKGTLSDEAYRRARADCLQYSRKEGIDALLDQHHLDALVCLSRGPASLIDPVNGDGFTGGSSSLPAIAGYPNITVPAGYFRSLPVGLSFYGTAWTDGRILALAADYEEHTHLRIPPAFAPTVP